MSHYSKDDHVLHVIDTADVSCCQTTLAMLSDLAKYQSQSNKICVIGKAWENRELRELGLAHVDRVSLPFGQQWSAHHALRSYINQNSIQRPFDVIHAWSLSAMHIASKAVNHIPIVVSITQTPAKLFKPRLENTLFLPIHDHLANMLQSHFPQTPCQTILPGLNALRLADPDQRKTVRMTFGVNDENTKIIYVLGDPNHRVDTLRAAWPLGLISSIGIKFKMVVSPYALNRDRARKYISTTADPGTLVVHRAALWPWEILVGCDLAIALDSPITGQPAMPKLKEPAIPGIAGGLSLAWAMYAGLPVVAESTAAVHALTNNQPDDEFLTPPSRPRKQAHLVSQYVENPSFHKKISLTLQSRAQLRFNFDHYISSMNLVYRSMIHRVPLKIPAPNSQKVVDLPYPLTS